MAPRENLSAFMQCHKAVDDFEYDLAVDWAIQLIREGVETENILMLASFSKPVTASEIRPYVSAVLEDLGMEEKNGSKGVIGQAYFHLQEILNGHSIRKHLRDLYQLCIDTNHEYGLTVFYLIYCGWQDLEEMGVNHYSEATDTESILQELKTEATLWINKQLKD